MRIIRLLSLVIVIFICFTTVGCSERIIGKVEQFFKSEKEILNKRGEVETFISEFFSTVTNGDILKAEEYLHPHFVLIEENLSDYLDMLQKRESIDFSNTIEIKEIKNLVATGISPELNFNGECFDFEYAILIGEVEKTCYITVVNNEEGYGIYRFTFTDCKQ